MDREAQGAADGRPGDEATPGGAGVLWLIVPVGIAALVIAALILTRIAGPLYGLLFPPDVPLPAGAQEVERVEPERGAAYRIYRTALSGEDVAAFYEAEGSTCQYVGPVGEERQWRHGVQTIAQCQGSSISGGQRVSWEVYIADGYPEAEGPTRFRVYRYAVR